MGCSGGYEGYSANEVSISVCCSVLLCSVHIFGFCCVMCAEYDRKLSSIDPSSFPIDRWLECCKPRVP